VLGVGDQLCPGAWASLGRLVAGAVARAWVEAGCQAGDGDSGLPTVGHAAGAAAAGLVAIQLGPSRRAAAGPSAAGGAGGADG
jgi:hypothetical protein